MMRDWVVAAVCHNDQHIMFDPHNIHVALALCDECPVQPECLADYLEWPAEFIPGMVIAGLDRHHTKSGKPRYRTVIEKKCRTCHTLFRVEPGSTRRYCRMHYDPGPAPVEDLAVLSGTLEALLEAEGLGVIGWEIQTS
jgi:hypothetical protein